MTVDDDRSANMRRYAVIFRTHFWDAFAQRQFDRLVSQVGNGDVFILVDETNGPVLGIRHDKVVRLTEQDLCAMGLPRAGTGNMLWFNGDYPLYYFATDHGAYDYYVYLEYDVVVNTDIDRLIERVAADGADFVGLTKGEPVHEWAWLHTCAPVYDLAQIRYKLICFSILSNKALKTLAARRLEMSDQLRRSAIEEWPYCEGFIATEMNKPDFVNAELSSYLDTSAYDTWPPFVESDLPIMVDHPVIHPVLDQNRYIDSLLKYKVGLAGYVNPVSQFHRKLRRLPASSYLSALTSSFTQKAIRTIRQQVG